MARIAVWNRQETGGSEQTREAQSGDTLEDGEGVALTVRQDNYDANRPPSVTDDSSAGYGIGSRWIDTVGQDDYVCVDATAGAAVWERTNNAGSAFDPTAIHKAIPNEINPIPLKGILTQLDKFVIEDSAAAWAKKSAPINAIAFALRLDSLAEPLDSTNLDSTTARHGLLPKLEGSLTKYLRADGTWDVPSTGASDVKGPASATDDALARFDGTTGKLIKNSTVTLSDAGDIDMGGGAISNVGNVDGVDVSAHASRHEPGGSDAMAVDAVPATGSLRTLGSGAQQACAGNDARLSDARTPTAHETTHRFGGLDALKLDDLDTPDDNTDLDATTGRHGLLPKLGGGTVNYLRADGTWAKPPDIGFTEDQHKVLRQLIHFIDDGPAEGFASGAYRETTGTVFPTAVVWWESSSKLKKIVERLITWSGGKVTQDQWKIYDTDGVTVLWTVTDAISYSGAFETNRTRTIA